MSEAPAAAGMSGGPLLSAEGVLVGINTVVFSAASETRYYAGVTGASSRSLAPPMTTCLRRRYQPELMRRCAARPLLSQLAPSARRAR